MAFTQYSIHSPKGFPDLVLLRPPRIIFAELKREKGKTRPEQATWLSELNDIHNVAVDVVEVYLWRPSDIEEIAQILR